MRAAGNRSVAVIVTIGDDAPFLADALRSCIEQTVRPTEILLVNTRPDDKAERIAASVPGVVVHREENANYPAAKRAGLARVSSEFTVFLDANDRLTPLAIMAGLECFDKNPDAWLVCGAHRIIDSAGRMASPAWHERLDPPQPALRAGNAIAMQAAVLYRTNRLRTMMGFDANREEHEDQDPHFPSPFAGLPARHDYCVAEYRSGKRMMLMRALVGHQTNQDHSRGNDAATQVERRMLFHHNAPRIFAASANALIRNGWNSDSAKMMLRAAKMAPFALLKTLLSRSVQAIMRHFPRAIGRHFGEALWAPGVGKVRFGDFGRTTPISADYGFDRGTPIDRYYIERALEAHCELVRGRVLEVTERKYTRSFGAEKVVRSDVLDIDPLNPAATVIGDLGVVGALPDGAFDCIVLTQTLQFIYNIDNAISNLYRALAPGGALLITVPGISPIAPDEIKYWYWAFTGLSLKTMLSERFGASNVEIKSYGNVFAAICFLTGISLAEVGPEKLDYMDEKFPVTVFACARKPH
jgi:hypothetical protein